MIDNDWQASQYPLVPGHEVVGTIVAAGRNVRRLQPGQRVGVGWFAKSCMSCEWCLRGDHNLCASAQGIFGAPAARQFCRSRAHDQGWATILPDKIDIAKAGPLFCGGSRFSTRSCKRVRPVELPWSASAGWGTWLCSSWTSGAAT
jgi:uncharacterized zinc-type alcohol dehydrogenase-like protein